MKTNNNTTGRTTDPVADYFAILGTGETFEWISTQKKLQSRQRAHQSQQQSNQNQNESIDESESDINSIIKQEEECQLMERFYREICQIGILAVYSNHNGERLAAQLTTSDLSGYGGTTSSDGNDDDELNASAFNSSSMMHHEEEEMEIRTPIISLARKGNHNHANTHNNNNKHSNDGDRNANDNMNMNSNNPLPKEISGFEIIYETIPVNPPNYGQDPDNHNHREVDMSLSMNTTFDSKGALTLNQTMTGDGGDIDIDELWRKGEIFAADLHPSHGYRKTLQSKLQESDSYQEFLKRAHVHGNGNGNGNRHGMEFELEKGDEEGAENNMDIRNDLSLSLDASFTSFHYGGVGPNTSGMSMDNDNDVPIGMGLEMEINNDSSLFDTNVIADQNEQNGHGHGYSKGDTTVNANAGTSKTKSKRFLKRMRDNVAIPKSMQNIGINKGLSKMMGVASKAKDVAVNRIPASIPGISMSKSMRERGKSYDDLGEGDNGQGGDVQKLNLNGGRFNANTINLSKTQYYVGYRRRGADEIDKPSISECGIYFVRIHKRTIVVPNSDSMSGADTGADTGTGTGSGTGTLSDSLGQNEKEESLAGGKHRQQKQTPHNQKNPWWDESNQSRSPQKSHLSPNHANTPDDHHGQDRSSPSNHKMLYDTVRLEHLLPLPMGSEEWEWVIPDMYQKVQLPIPPSPSRSRMSPDRGPKRDFNEAPSSSPGFVHDNQYVRGNAGTSLAVNTSTMSEEANLSINLNETRDEWIHSTRDSMMPHLVSQDWSSFSSSVPPSPSHLNSPPNSHSKNRYDPMVGGGEYEYVPILAFRRQKVGEEERFKEDPGMVELGLTFSGLNAVANSSGIKSQHQNHQSCNNSAHNTTVMPLEEVDEFEEEQQDDDPILGMSSWNVSFGCQKGGEVQDDNIDAEEADFSHAGVQSACEDGNMTTSIGDYRSFGMPRLICKRNVPLGFLDVPFATRVLDRFPKKDYKGVPLPEEELPMFCYPTGCKLSRARYQDAPLPEHYGFVVKNERGDSIHVSCVSFMEPLERAKLDQLDSMSEARKRTSLPHKFYCKRQNGLKGEKFLTGFDEMMTFEYKTICLISRYPFWSAFRRFLSHLHVLSGSSSDLPLERYISHLLLTVPVPKPGGQCILVPLPAIASPMVLALPPLKDLPLLDLSFRRLFSCLDVPTVVTIVLGFLALERKVVIMSSYPSLVSDICELLRSLLFPFDLCAPYVPRLTEPFMSCLNFPGAIFAGIHDDGCPEGLASSVRKNIPEDTFIVDLDTGDIDCNGERFEVLKDCWEIIPNQIRSHLVDEIETLCQDAKIYPGQEPTGVEIEAALDLSDVSFSPMFEGDDAMSLDDRAIRDAFLRFFCSLLGGYERFLLVPDIDFLVSGAEWFDEKGFIASTRKQSRAAFLHAFVSTQLFQSFIQRRTEASDVQCLLFDECLSEYHSTQEPYGRLSGTDKQNYPKYELLVDQCAADICNVTEVDETSSAGTSLTQHTSEGFMLNNNGDFVTAPLNRNLPPGHRYVYYIDGNPHFPQELDPEMYYPKEPEYLSTEFDQIPVPILTRSDREIDVSVRRRKLAISHRGIQRQRRCLFQLPKLMASHFFNSWLMCIPSQVSQEFQSPDQQAVYLLRALGALRVLRSHHRIIPDEAGYRCLIIACGRVDSDRRQEVVKLFGLLRSDGLFPSAVTLGQYTRAIAEGYSKQSSAKANSIITEAVRASTSPDFDNNLLETITNLHVPNALDFLDGNVMDLDDAGTRWRQGREARRAEATKNNLDNPEQKPKLKTHSRSKHRQQRAWLPVSSSSSFSPHWKPSKPIDETFDLMGDFRFIALWSRATACKKCSHILLDEEVQAGWDNLEANNTESSEVKCPCCDSIVQPLLGYFEMPPRTPDIAKNRTNDNSIQKNGLPFQVQNVLSVESEDMNDERFGSVPYLSPSQMRSQLERIIEEFGEDVLEREKLRYLNPTVFFCLWWYCCRFDLPLPLSVSRENTTQSDGPVYNNHCCAFASWDKSIAVAACHSAEKSVLSLQNLIRKSNRPKVAPSFQNLVNSFQKSPADNVASFESSESGETTASLQSPLKDDFPLLANLNFQSLGQGDWDNADLSAVLVKLVEACDKRDFYPALEAILKCNNDRRAKYGTSTEHNVELDCYSTLLYLARYQCTSAFHKFFPTTSKTCKGYHFWCPNATVSIFDRMFRDALDRIRAQGNITPINDISDIALGFRSVFGHII